MINERLTDEELFPDALIERYPTLSLHQAGIYFFVLHGYSDNEIAEYLEEPFVTKITEKIKYIKKKIS